MISYLSGKIVLKKNGFIILNTNGIGYEVFISKASMENMPEVGQDLKLFCHLDVNERSLRLFGFVAFEELELFKLIRGISGVGPKASLEIASAGPLEKINKQITSNNINFLDNIPGIGQKRAQKIVLELSGKLKSMKPKKTKEREAFENDEAFSALLNLGFSKDQAKTALSQLPIEIKNPQEKVKQALQILGT